MNRDSTAFVFFLRVIIFSTSRPDHGHKTLFDPMDAVDELLWLVVPDYQNSSVGNERGELMFCAATETGDIRKNLDAKILADRDRGPIVVLK